VLDIVGLQTVQKMFQEAAVEEQDSEFNREEQEFMEMVKEIL